MTSFLATVPSVRMDACMTYFPSFDIILFSFLYIYYFETHPRNSFPILPIRHLGEWMQNILECGLKAICGKYG
jgi:hypothetical protein